MSSRRCRSLEVLPISHSSQRPEFYNPGGSDFEVRRCHRVVEAADGDDACLVLRKRVFDRPTPPVTCRPAASSALQRKRVWDAWQAKRHRRGETDRLPAYTGNPFGHAD